MNESPSDQERTVGGRYTFVHQMGTHSDALAEVAHHQRIATVVRLLPREDWWENGEGDPHPTYEIRFDCGWTTIANYYELEPII